MKALLIFQEGPGAGPSYLLDPAEEVSLALGRSSGCNLSLNDQRASRHHCDLQWNGVQWEVRDRGSTNGTYVNGMRVRGPHGLQIGDRITVGETTMVLRELTRQPASPRTARPGVEPVLVSDQRASSRRPPEPPSGSPGKASGIEDARSGISAAFWVVQVLLAVAVVCLAAGALMPWLQVTGSLSQDLQPLLQGLAEIVAILSGQDSVFNVSQQIDGLQGYGKLTLLVALVSTVALVVDTFLSRRSVVAGIVYLVSGVMAGGAIAFDLVNYYRFYSQMKDLTLLFGIQLEEVVQVFDQFLDVTITPRIGLFLTGIGLILLLLGGGGRLLVAFLNRGR